MPEFEGKKFQNVAKEGLKLDDGTRAEEAFKALEDKFKPLTDWLKEKGLKDKVCPLRYLLYNLMFMCIVIQIEKAVVSQRLAKSPSALVASQYGWSGNFLIA